MVLREGTECGKMKSAAFLCASIFKKGSWLTGYIITYGPAGCPILLFVFFIKSGLEGKMAVLTHQEGIYSEVDEWRRKKGEGEMIV